MGLNSINGLDLVRMIQAGTALLEENKSRVDALNVFPVPDGDTGTNMYLTLLSATREAEKRQEDNIGSVGKAISMGSLMGARGNSGVILSQVFRGFAKELDSKPAINAIELAASLQAGSDTAYKAVMKPVEGTILTIVREVARAAVASTKQNDDIIQMMQESLEAGNRMLARTPQMLPVLKEAGVVDSGGQGFLILFEGMLTALTGEPVQTVRREEVPETVREVPARGVQVAEYGYCTEVLIRGDNLDVAGIQNKLDPMGNSMLVVGEDGIIKVHIHSLHPGKILEECLKWGSLHDIKIDNLEEEAEAQARLQTAGIDNSASDPVEANDIPSDLTDLNEANLLEDVPFQNESYVLEDIHEAPSVRLTSTPVPLSEYKETKRVGVVAVCQGDGWSEILKSLGVDKVVEGGQTMNPSTEDLLTAIESVEAENVILLPNNRNIIMAAQQARELSKKPVEVVPTVSVTQAIAAMVVFDLDSGLPELTAAMNEEIERVSFGEVTTAIRDSSVNGLQIKEDDIIGLINDEVKITGESPDEVVIKILEVIGQNGDLISLYYGNGTREFEAEALKAKVQAAHPMQDVELHYGGQQFYHYLISVE